MLRIENVTVHYGRKPALQNVTITVEQGEFVGVIGSNRAGKSTLSANDLRSDSLIGGRDYLLTGGTISQMASHRIPALGVAHVPEGRQLFPKLNVEENLMIGAILPEARGRAKESSGDGLRVIPPSGATAEPDGRVVIRRGAADGGDRPRAHAAAPIADAR